MENPHDHKAMQTEPNHKKDSNESGKHMHRWNSDREIKALIATIGALALAAIIFFAGIVVGRLQDRFVFRRSAIMIGKNSGMPSPYFTTGMLGMGGNMRFSFINSNGVKGLIASVSGNDISIQGSNGTNETITITPETIIKNGDQDITISELSKGEQITVIGDPNTQGGIIARFIRVQE